jgi:hypothetical protein
LTFFINKRKKTVMSYLQTEKRKSKKKEKAKRDSLAMPASQEPISSSIFG